MAHRAQPTLRPAGALTPELTTFIGPRIDQYVAAHPIVSATSLGSKQFGFITIFAYELKIPLAVMISPFYSSLASLLLRVQEANVAGVSTTKTTRGIDPARKSGERQSFRHRTRSCSATHMPGSQRVQTSQVDGSAS